MADECDLESVKEIILSHGGKIRNADLVTRYRKFLDHPNNKAVNREKFKDFVNTLATIKKDETGEKFLLLKKKYRTGSANRTSTVSLSSSDSCDSSRAHSEPPKPGPTSMGEVSDDVDGANFSRVKSEGHLGSSSPPSSVAMETTSASSVSTADSSMSAEEEEKEKEKEKADVANMSVKERAQHLNKIESETELQRAPGKRKESKGKDREGEGDEDSQSGFGTLGPKEKEWLLTCCTADYHPISKLISHNPSLVKVRDITNTALHWAAKHGKPEVVKMIAGVKPGVNVNQRSGYTPLHLAAIQGHEEIIELLVGSYKADPNIRDYGGKKAKHYLRNSPTSRASQLLMSRRHQHNAAPTITTSLDESFLRSASFRKSRTKALSSLMSAPFMVKTQQLRTSWGGSTEEVFEQRSNPDSNPATIPPHSAGSSPHVRRKGSLQMSHDNQLMPPPVGQARRKKSKSGSRDTSPANAQFSRTGSDPNLRSQTSTSTFV